MVELEFDTQATRWTKAFSTGARHAQPLNLGSSSKPPAHLAQQRLGLGARDSRVPVQLHHLGLGHQLLQYRCVIALQSSDSQARR